MYREVWLPWGECGPLWGVTSGISTPISQSFLLEDNTVAKTMFSNFRKTLQLTKQPTDIIAFIFISRQPLERIGGYGLESKFPKKSNWQNQAQTCVFGLRVEY